MGKKPKWTPKPGLRLAIPGKGILIVDEVCGESYWPESPWRLSVELHWAGQSKFRVDGAEWIRMTDLATKSRW
jgi:hypothetical protein